MLNAEPGTGAGSGSRMSPFQKDFARKFNCAMHAINLTVLIMLDAPASTINQIDTSINTLDVGGVR